MRQQLRCVIFSLIISATLGCGGGSSSDSSSNDDSFSSGGGSLIRTAIDAYVNDFIIQTYSSLAASASALHAAVTTLVQTTNDANLETAKAAWVAARIPWEKSETALFGPVDFYGFDPALDSWPVNKTDLDAVLSSGNALTQDTVKNFENTLKGFHTIEYLLWGEDSLKSAAELTEREKQYLLASTEELASIANSLLAAWTSGYAGQQPYAKEVTLAGQGSTSFPSEQTAVEQMVRGMLVICDEVANGKIADPFDTRDPNIVESQFSFNSIADFSNNIRGAQEAYITAVSRLIAADNPALDAKVRTQLETAIAAVLQIPEPFRNAILDSSNDSIIVNAQQKIRELANTLEGEVLPEVLS